jgi:hypothetical protein
MRLIDADKFLKYLIFSKHIDGLTCGEVKEAIEMCKVDIFDKIRAEILRKSYGGFELGEGFMDGYNTAMVRVLNILDKYKSESEK